MTTEIIERNGKTYAVIPYDFYQQLIEDAEMLADIKAYDAVKNKSEESFSSEVVNKIFLKEENPIKVYREYRNLTQLELAKKTQINFEILDKIEKNISIASLENLETIAQILNIDLDMII